MTSLNEIHPKGWGYEKWIVNKKEYCGKLLFIKKGRNNSNAISLGRPHS
jgi:hypothetical protein